MKSEILKSLLGLPTSTSQNNLQQKLKSFISEFDFDNVDYDDSSLYNNHAEFCIFINPEQDIVDAGLPKQTNIFCSIEDNIIEVACLAKTYREEDEEMEFTKLESLPFSWQTLETLLLKYQPQTYMD